MQTATTTKTDATERKSTSIITVVLPREETARLKTLARKKGMLFSSFLAEALQAIR